MSSDLIPSRAELIAEVQAELGPGSPEEEVVWLVDNVLLPAFRELVARGAEGILNRFTYDRRRPN